MAMKLNSALHRAIVNVVPLRDRKEFEDYFYTQIETVIRSRYQTWNFNRKYREDHGHENSRNRG